MILVRMRLRDPVSVASKLLALINSGRAIDDRFVVMTEAGVRSRPLQ
jgi:hypothetical protein